MRGEPLCIARIDSVLPVKPGAVLAASPLVPARLAVIGPAGALVRRGRARWLDEVQLVTDGLQPRDWESWVLIGQLR